MLLQAGLVHELSVAVTAELTAHAMGNTGVHVLATPHLVRFVEFCSVKAIEPFLEAGQSTVGTLVNLRHLAATPVGDTVRIRSELVEVAGRRLAFRVQGWDSAEQVVDATHERFIVDLERFLARVAAKQAAIQR